MVYWIRQSDGACAVSAIGDSSGLLDDYWINMSGGDDRIIVGGGYSFFCNGWKSAGGPIPLGGRYLDLAGGDGNDRIWNVEGTNTWLFGFAGDDRLHSRDRTGRLLGHDGNDTVQYLSPGGVQFTNTEWLDGGSGDDCLDEAGDDRYQYFDCGPDSDTVAYGPGGNPKSNCETFVVNLLCPNFFNP